MGRQIRPAQVFKTVTNEMNHLVLSNRPLEEPPWYRVVGAIPPAETLVRTIPPQQRQPNRKATKPKNIYKPQQIRYREDSLRTTFYKHHPWELARPRIVLESDGKDYQHCDWSKGVRQPGIPLTGECVVQRQMWLMDNKGLGKGKAYDQSRREFYRLRQAEEVERRVAIEEARYVGAYFGQTRQDVGMRLEDQETEAWKRWAVQETERLEAMAKSQIETFDVEDDTEDAALVEEEPAKA